MSDQMGRPKVLSDDMVRVETTVARSDKKALAAMADESGMSERSLLRLFITTGMQAYSNTVAAMEQMPATPAPRRRVRR
ncbi:hypothetical protein [Microbacterium sp. As-52]|uniref:hypothetical protein n=1 Tax=Microbacterium sp. As-52 TaxID=3390503 RepID=UPI003CF0ABE5